MIMNRRIGFFLVFWLSFGFSAGTFASVIIADSGQSDSIIVDSVEVLITDTLSVPVRFFTDQPLTAIEITLKQDSPDLLIDSFSFVGGRLDYINLKGFAESDTTITIFAFVSDEAFIAPGPGLVGQIFLSAPGTPIPQTVFFDSTTVVIDLVERADYFTDTTIASFVPQFQPGYLVLRSSCCVGTTGNVDHSPDNTVDIGDLTLLISYLFIDPQNAPPCLDDANVDGSEDGIVDIGDLTALIGYLFVNPAQSPLAPCPQ